MTQYTPATGKIDISKLTVVVAQFNGGGDIERHLSILGVKKPHISGNVAHIRRSIEKDRPDLVVCAMTPDQPMARNLLRGIRHQDIGANPFPVLISLAESMGDNHDAGLTDLGIDSLLAGRFSRDDFVLRVNDLAWNRKRFVATPSYVGPTRRVLPRPERGAGEEFEVPNPVRASGTGVSKEALWREIAAASKNLNTRKLTVDVMAVRKLVYEIMPDYQHGNVTDAFRRRVEELDGIIALLHRRAGRMGYEDMASLCELAGDVVGEIRACPTPPNLKHLKVMPKLVTGFQAALSSSRMVGAN